MSVSVEQPLHFSQHLQPPTSPPPPPPIDADMSTSVASLPPAGQRHDRQDANMDDEQRPPAAPPTTSDIPAESRESSTTTVAVEVAAVDQDAMDTSPDTDQMLIVPADVHDSAPLTPTSPASTEVAQSEPGNSNEAPPAALADMVSSLLHIQLGSVAERAQSQTNNELPMPPPPPTDPSPQPPPPPPPVEPVHEDEDSSEDEDGVQPWHPIQEDLSSPDETELKEIESGSEHSALDHDYWESKAFLPVDEPEYTIGTSGRIHWSIDAYNGTRENPNRDLVMKSEPVSIGGHEWQIKFYPKGNDSDYLSVYLECLSVMDKDSKSDADQSGDDAPKGSPPAVFSEIAPLDDTSTVSCNKFQHTPLPLLDAKQMPKRKSVAAQVSVVLYNPTEPRVNYSRTALHRFCSGSPDWGWTRFHGPYYDIAQRMRGQRQALLRDDKLAFTGYVRIVEDETDCLWEHHSRENQWDSFAMTGLQSLMLGEDASAPGGNMISAVASWMLFKPFRHLLYSIKTPVPEEEPFTRPQPLVSALQNVLYKLRTHVEPGAGPVSLDGVLDALEWYGIHDRVDKLDVIETWEILLAKLREELDNTPHAASLQSLFGTTGAQTFGAPNFRIPVVGVGSMQKAVNKAAATLAFPQIRPQLLSIELERQEFDLKSRSYVKLLNQVTLDDHIAVGDTQYTLYGHIVHKQTLQSYVYQPVLRPEGPGSKWYSYSDSKDENQVKCLTKQQAVDAYEGKPGNDRVVGNDSVAYIAMYVRNDVAHQAFAADTDTDSEPWDVPTWIQKEAEETKASALDTSMLPPPPEEPVALLDEPKSAGKGEPETANTYDFEVMDSRLFAQHQGPGFFNVYDPKWKGSSDLVYRVQLSDRDDCKTIREKLSSVIKDIKDPRQLKFWLLDPIRGSLGRPAFQGTGKIDFSCGSYDRYAELKEWDLRESSSACRILWVHVLDFSSLPELSDEGSKPTEPVDRPSTPKSTNDIAPQTAGWGDDDDEQASTNNVQSDVDAAPTEVPALGDTPMSDPDEPQQDPPAQPILEINTADTPEAPNIPQIRDTAMEEVETPSLPDPPAFNGTIPRPPAPSDTEMGGTQEELLLPPPPPPPFNYPTEPDQPPPPSRTPSPEPPADEIYFFLKFFDPERQTLEPRGSYVALKSARVDETVLSLLNLPAEDKKRIDIWEEEDLATTRTIKHRRSFAQVDLHNAAIVIVALPLSNEQPSNLAARAAFADPSSYLTFCNFARNFPLKLTGHFIQNHFSSQYYKGDIHNGHRHGHGNMIYHSGATYEGTFRLDQRHGHGLYTFQNGDTYDGDWVDNQQHGTGTFVEAATGNTYVGGWKNDKKFGEGVTHWKNAQEAERLCRICWEDAADAVFYDCGHVVSCLQCAREVQNCPVCRKRVLSAMKLYYVA
jgi:hypothetical protein